MSIRIRNINNWRKRTKWGRGATCGSLRQWQWRKYSDLINTKICITILSEPYHYYHHTFTTFIFRRVKKTVTCSLLNPYLKLSDHRWVTSITRSVYNQIIHNCLLWGRTLLFIALTSSVDFSDRYIIGVKENVRQWWSMRLKFWYLNYFRLCCRLCWTLLSPKVLLIFFVCPEDILVDLVPLFSMLRSFSNSFRWQRDCRCAAGDSSLVVGR